MPQIGIDQLGASKPNTWSPQHIEGIIKGIKDLMVEYKNLKGIMGSMGNDQSGNQSQPQVTGNTVTTSMIQDFVKRFCDSLITQGKGDKKIGEVLNDLPYTVKQVRALLQ